MQELDNRRFNGTSVSKFAWSTTEDTLLRVLYPNPKKSWAEICEALPRRSPASITKRASEYGLRRRSTNKSSDVPLLKRLWQERESKEITRAELAKKMGYHEMMLGRWERGEARPSLLKLVDWCEVLGLELTAVQKRPLARAT